MSEADGFDGEVCELLRDLIRCDSVNPPGNEAGVADVLERYLARPGIETWRSEVVRGRPNLYARIGSHAPTLLLNGHMDTVPAGSGWTQAPFGAALTDGRIYGRGACDMKAGLATCAVVLARLAAAPATLHGSVVLAAVVDEERNARGAKHLVDRDRVTADAAIVAEPTRMRLVTSTNGQLNFGARLHGLAAHSSEPALGHSAIRDARRLADALESHDPPYLVGSIVGGAAPNVVPASCELAIDRRVRVHETLAGVEAEFAAMLAAATAAAPRPGEYDVPLAVPPFSLRADHVVTRTIGRTLGQDPPFGHSEQTMDASWFADAGIPTVVLGPCDPSLAHRADEHVLVDELVDGTRLLGTVVVDLLAALGRDGL